MPFGTTVDAAASSFLATERQDVHTCHRIKITHLASARYFQNQRLGIPIAGHLSCISLNWAGPLSARKGFPSIPSLSKTGLFQSFVRQILLKGPARTAQGLHGLSVFGLEITQQPTCQGCFRRCLAGSSFEHTLPVHTYLQLYLPRNHIPQKPLCMHWIAYAARFLMTRDSLMDSGFFATCINVSRATYVLLLYLRGLALHMSLLLYHLWSHPIVACRPRLLSWVLSCFNGVR